MIPGLPMPGGGGSLALDMGSDAGSGDSATGAFNVGGLMFGSQKNENMGLYVAAAAVLIAALILKK